ncbi:MAG: hypothetical protein H7831_11550 [Magnetococcus sp. WYHC-3]
MKIWVTKYATTQGILVYEHSNVVSDFPTMVEVRSMHPTAKVEYSETFHKPDWHTDEQEAIERADKKRSAAITALEKKIKKLKQPVKLINKDISSKED